jgi:hypothetical protein
MSETIVGYDESLLYWSRGGSFVQITSDPFPTSCDVCIEILSGHNQHGVNNPPWLMSACELGRESRTIVRYTRRLSRDQRKLMIEKVLIVSR